MTKPELPKWVEKHAEEMGNQNKSTDEIFGFLRGARLVLDRLAPTVEGDYKSDGPEAKALNIARERMRKEVLNGQA